MKKTPPAGFNSSVPLPKAYEGSRAGTSSGGRTHTFGVRQAGKRLKNSIVFQHPGIKLVGGKPTPAED